MPKRVRESLGDPEPAQDPMAQLVGEPGDAVDLEEAEEVLVQPREEAMSLESLSIEARIVYLGQVPHKSVYYGGTADPVPDPADPEGKRVLWRPSPEGATGYDFSRLDVHGRPILERLTKRDRRPWALCRHVGHCLRFLQERTEDGAPEFQVRAGPEVKAKIERYARMVMEAELRNQDHGRPVLAAMGLL